MKKLLNIVCAAMIIGACSAVNVLAHNNSDNMLVSVSATVIATCSVTAKSLDFGVYTMPAVADLEGVATVTVNCNLPSNYTIDADHGTHFANERRRMRNGKDTLTYDLYTSSSRTTTWGSGMPSGAKITGSGKNQTHTIYGRIPMNQIVSPGSYTDVVTVILNW